MFIILCTVFTIAPIASAANILIFWPVPIPSHFRGFEPLFTELAFRGHNVTVVSHFPKSTSVVNYTDIAITDDSAEIDKSMKLSAIPMNAVNYNSFKSILVAWGVNKKYAESTLHLKNIQDFISSESYAFDLVLIESFYQEYTVTMGHKFGAPVVCITSTQIQPTNSHWIGLPSTFSYILDVRARTSDRKTFYGRLISTCIGFVQIYLERYLYVPSQEDYANRYFRYKNCESRPSIGEMLANVSLTLVHGDLSVGAPRPYLPGVVEVGGLHMKAPKQLPDGLKTFIESARHGVILISFGTYMHPCSLPKHVLDMLIAVVGNLKQKVLWKWACNTTKPNLPADNVMLNTWFPQFDVLNHPNVKLFITHGGLHSVEESTYNAVPMVGMPFFGDQYTNIKMIEQKGFGKLVELFDINENTLHEVIDELLSNPEYKKNAIAFSEIFKDGFLKPIDKAIYWIEYVLRNEGARHLKNDSTHLNFIQYFLIDVIVSLMVFIILVIYCFYKIFSTLKLSY